MHFRNDTTKATGSIVEKLVAMRELGDLKLLDERVGILAQ